MGKEDDVLFPILVSIPCPYCGVTGHTVKELEDCRLIYEEFMSESFYRLKNEEEE